MRNDERVVANVSRLHIFKIKITSHQVPNIMHVHTHTYVMYVKSQITNYTYETIADYRSKENKTRHHKHHEFIRVKSYLLYTSYINDHYNYYYNYFINIIIIHISAVVDRFIAVVIVSFIIEYMRHDLTVVVSNRHLVTIEASLGYSSTAAVAYTWNVGI